MILGLIKEYVPDELTLFTRIKIYVSRMNRRQLLETLVKIFKAFNDKLTRQEFLQKVYDLTSSAVDYQIPQEHGLDKTCK